jgi:hypothetical protein
MCIGSVGRRARSGAARTARKQGGTAAPREREAREYTDGTGQRSRRDLEVQSKKRKKKVA